MQNAHVYAFGIFSRLSEEIYSKIDKENPDFTFDHVITFVVNGSLTCELGFKAILNQKYADEKGHDLSLLFKKLDLDEQAFIKERMPSLSSDAEFDNLLSSTSKNFIEWRYFYEKDVKANWLFIHELIDALGMYFDGESYTEWLRQKHSGQH